MSDKKKTICVLIPAHWDAAMGGAQFQAMRIVHRLIEEGDSNVIYLARQIAPSTIAKGYEIRQIGNSKLNRFILDAPSLLRTLNELKPDTIYSRVGCAYTGIAAFYARGRSCRLVWHIASNADVEPWSGSFLQMLRFKYLDKLTLEYGVRKADVIIAQTHDQARLLSRNYGRTVDEVVSNFHPPAKEHVNKAANQVEILWIANLKQIKQPELFLELADMLQDLPARFVMIGANQLVGPSRDSIERAMARLPNFEYLGEMDNNEVNARLAIAHLLVNTSKTEGFSNTFIQAWMRRVPVLSLNVDPDGLFSAQGLGRCAAGDLNRLAQIVREWVSDPSLREIAGEKAKIFADQSFGDGNLTKLSALLRNVKI